MTHHITEPTELFPHLESRDLHTVQEFKALIQDHLYSGARDSSFQNALVDFYIRTNSQHALDILSRVREPLDKPLVDKLNDCMKGAGRLQSLTLLSHIVRRQPTWLHKIVQTNLYSSLLQCLKTSCDCPEIMCGLLTITTLLPMIPSLIGPSLNDIFEIFARFAQWNLHRPGGVPEVYQIHIHAAVYALFHRLYGMFPWNFIEFLREHHATRIEDFNTTVMPMLERVRLHPQLILGSEKVETEATRWRKMEVHDILTECSRVALDLTESAARDDISLYSVSGWSESGRTSSASLISQARRTSSPLETSRSSQDKKQKQALQQHHPAHKAALETPAHIDPTAMIWSPSVFCGLATPPTSRPGSPGSSLLDASFNSSIQLFPSANTPTPLSTPRDSPGVANLTDDVKAACYSSNEGVAQIGRSSSASKLRSKLPPPIRNLPHAHRTVSAPSTPGYSERKSVPPSPHRKNSATAVSRCFNFESDGGGAGKSLARGTNARSQRSRESSGDSTDGGQRSSRGEQKRGSMVSMKDLPHVIKGLSGNRLDDGKEDDLEVSCELSDIAQTSASLHHEEADQMGTCQPAKPLPVDDSSCEKQLPFHVDFALSEIPCSKLRRELQGKKEQLISDGGGDLNEEYITGKLREFCLQQLRKTATAPTPESEQEKSLPIPVPHSQEANNHPNCEVCSSAGKSIEVTQVTGGSTPMSNTLEGGFTPIRDPPVGPFKVPEVPSTAHTTTSESNVIADGAPYAHLFPYAMASSWPQKGPASVESSMEFPPGGPGYATPQASRGSSDIGAPLSSMTYFSPNEVLDRHIQLGDTVHTKELSMLPLTSQTSVNWTHFGGAAPADEVNILKNQVVFLHNQVLYERHKKEVHAERNRRLLGKTHKAKASQELNIAMKDQIKLQEQKIDASQRKCELLRLERNRLLEELEKRGSHFEDLFSKMEKDKSQLKECNSELQKLLVEHKREVDQARKQLQKVKSELNSTQKELEIAHAELGTTKRLKDEVTWLNKELLLMGEVNQKLREKALEDQATVRSSEEHALLEKTMRRELADLKETLSEKVVQLNASKTRITELEAVITNKDVSISEQKRFLETMKSLSKGRIEAIESKYSAQKKVNQRLEASILKLKKSLYEQKGKEIFLPRVYERSNSEQIAEGLRQNEPGCPDDLQDRRVSWHSQGLSSLQSTPVKGRVPPTNNTSPNPVGRSTDSPASMESSLGSCDHPVTTKISSETVGANSVKHKTDELAPNSRLEQKNEIGRAPPSTQIQFSPSSPFQRVRSSNSEPTGNGIGPSKHLEGRESKSWPHTEGTHIPSGTRLTVNRVKAGVAPLVVELSDGRRALVEDETSHIIDESLASILEMDRSVEVRQDQES